MVKRVWDQQQREENEHECSQHWFGPVAIVVRASNEFVPLRPQCRRQPAQAGGPSSRVQGVATPTARTSNS